MKYVKRAHPKRTAKKGARKARRVPRSKFGNPRSSNALSGNYAKTVESVIYISGLPNQLYNGIATLQDFERSAALAPSFQWYRITNLVYKYTPKFNNYTDPATGGVSPTMPQFWRIMNRNGSFSATNTAQLAIQGAKPIPFTKALVVKYKPNTLITTAIAGNDGTSVMSSSELEWDKWIPTANVSGGTMSWPNVPYYGHQYVFQQDVLNTAEDAGYIFDVEITATIEFKDPSFAGLVGKAPALSAAGVLKA